MFNELMMTKKSILYALVAAVIFSTLEPVGKAIADQINPYAITALRFFVGGLVLLPFGLIKMRAAHIRLSAKDFGLMAGLGIFLICASMVTLQVAVKLSDSPAAIAIVFCANSVFTIGISAVFLREKLSGIQIVAILFCVFGVYLCMDADMGTGSLVPVLLAVFAALSFSVYTILTKKFMSSLPGVLQLSVSFILGSLALLLILTAKGINVLEGVTMETIGPMLYLSFVVTGFGYWIYLEVLEFAGPTAAAFAFFMKPVLSPVITLLVNGIPLTWNVIAAAAFVLLGSCLNLHFPKKIGRTPPPRSIK